MAPKVTIRYMVTNLNLPFSLILPDKFNYMNRLPDKDTIFHIKDQETFVRLALEVFAYQYHHNKVYRMFCDALKRDPKSVKCLSKIPFLPVSFFQSHKVVSFDGDGQITFTSSGTTGSVPAKHYVSNLGLYEMSFKKGFEHFYGAPHQYAIVALLPGYLERSGSSLIYMMNHLIKESGQPESGFYLNNLQKLAETLEYLHASSKKILLVGVSFALLDLAERFPVKIPNAIIMETGGMKGRRRELVREELHDTLKAAFGVETIHSEYGMTELLSQAYSKGQGIFEVPSWMKVIISDVNDPLSLSGYGKTGGINIIDLANLHSCSFIATQDLGRVFPDNTFEVLGRFDYSAVRGCNLMVE